MANIMIRNRCNQACIYCANPQLIKQGIKESSAEEIFQEIDKVTAENLCFTGEGEPTMAKELPEFIRYAKKKGIKRVGVESNGMMFFYEDYVKKLKQSGLYYCIISLHSKDEEVSDTISRTPGAFRKTIQGIKNLQKNRIKVLSILHTINKVNYRSLKDFIIFMNKEFNIDDFSLSFIRPISTKESKEITPSLSDAKKYIHNALKYCRKNFIRIIVSASYGIPLCFMRGFEDYSEEFMLYNFYGEEVHKKMSHAKEKIKDKKCSSCSFDHCCSGIPRTYAEIYTTKELNPQKADVKQLAIKIWPKLADSQRIKQKQFQKI